MKNIFLLTSLIITQFSFSQWNLSTQTCFGGTTYDDPKSSLTLSNGNHLVIVESNSGISGDKTVANIGGMDLWVVVFDNNLQIVWQKAFGGTLDEHLDKVIETSDHKLLFMSNSFSPIGGTKTAPNYGMADIWLIKTELDGTLIWDKTYGGDQSEIATNIVELESGNFILFGDSDSGVSGNKTSPSIGSAGYADGWFLKIDSSGNILADHTFGGADDDFSSNGLIYHNHQLLVSYYSYSNISGDKTENSYGDMDFWICKFDTSGNLLQQKTIGGSASEGTSFLQLTSTGNYLLVGESNSPISGLKTENCFNNSTDCWLMVLDQNLSIISQKTIGGNNSDTPELLISTANNHFLIGASSFSNISTFKTENCKGGADNWFYSIDENLNFLKDKTIGSTNTDALNSALKLTNSTFLVFSSSQGSNTGDKTCPGYNTGTSSSPTDGWAYILDTDLGVKEIEKQSFNVYPNPVQNHFTIKSNDQISTIIVTGLDGKMVDQS